MCRKPRGAYESAPYLHDGRAARLEEVFTRYNPSIARQSAHPDASPGSPTLGVRSRTVAPPLVTEGNLVPNIVDRL